MNLSSDNFLIGLFDRISNVPSFDIVKRLFSVLFLLSYFLTPLWPAFAEAIEKQDFEWAEKIFNKLFKYSVIATSITTLIFLFFSKSIFHIWINRDFDPSWNLLISFYFFTLVSNVGGVMSSLFSSSKFISKQLLYVGLATTATIILKIIFLKYLNYNYLMWANVIAFSIFFIVPSIKLSNEYFKEKRSKV